MKRLRPQQSLLWLPTIVLAGFILSGCAAPLQQLSSAPHVLVLTDGTRIPCEITDYSQDELFFQAYQAAQGYRYGERIIITKIERIGVRDQGRFRYFPVQEFIDLYFERSEDARGKLVELPLPTYEQQQTRQPVPATVPKANPAETDSAGKSGIGFKMNLLTPLTPPEQKQPVDYASLADLIVNSGAAGLVLYRAEQNQQAGIDPDSSQQQLISAIRQSSLWQERKTGLRAAHRFALESFRTIYNDAPQQLRRTFGFRAPTEMDPFIAFLIFLKNNGSLLKARQIEKAQELFGEQGTRAMQDILANFDDWYYIVVLQAQKTR